MSDDLVARLRDPLRYATRDPICEESAAALEAKDARIAELSNKLRRTEITLRDRSRPHPGDNEQRDPPEVLATLGFWPDCSCCECYAIHCLSDALHRAEEAERDARRYRWLRDPSAGRHEQMCVCASDEALFCEKLDAALDAAIAEREKS